MRSHVLLASFVLLSLAPSASDGQVNPAEKVDPAAKGTLLWAYPPRPDLGGRELALGVEAVGVSQDGKLLVTCASKPKQSSPAEFRVWNMATGANQGGWTVSHWSRYLSLSPDGTMLVSGGYDDKERERPVLRAWRLPPKPEDAAQELWSVPFPKNETCLDGDRLEFTEESKTLWLHERNTWRMNPFAPSPALEMVGEFSTARVCFNPVSGYVAHPGVSGAVVLPSRAEYDKGLFFGKPLATFSTAGYPGHLAFTRDGMTLAATLVKRGERSPEFEFAAWDLKKREQIIKHPIDLGETAVPFDLILSTDGKHMASLTSNGLAFLDVTAKRSHVLKRKDTSKDYSDGLRPVGFLPDGTLVVNAQFAGVKFVHPVTGKVQHQPGR